MITQNRIRFLLFNVFLFSTTLPITAQIKIPESDAFEYLKEEKIREKWALDTLWIESLECRINYFVKLKRCILPEYFSLKSEIKNQVDSITLIKTSKLDLIYNYELDRKRNGMLSSADRNNGFVQPYSYLDLLMAIEVFDHFPDVYAIILNPVNKIVDPVVQPALIESVQSLVKEIIQSAEPQISINTKEKMHKLIKALEDTQETERFFALNKGAKTEKEKFENDFINILLWSVRN